MIALEWTFDPVIIAPLAASAVLYAVGAKRLWDHTLQERDLRPWQPPAFAAAWVSLVFALVTPFHALGGHLFTAHMIEHEVLMAAAAPLFCLSAPLRVCSFALPATVEFQLRCAAENEIIAAFCRRVTRPLNATILHGVAIWAWHAPPFFDAALTSTAIHDAQHLSFFVTALLFWSALFKGAREHFGAGALHIAITMVHTSVLGALIALSTRLLYPLQTADAAAFGLTPLEDQQLAGLIMWVPAGTVYAGAALVLLGLWITSKTQTREDHTRGRSMASKTLA